MEPITIWTSVVRSARRLGERIALAVLILLCAVSISDARADMVLVSNTTLVSGTQSSVYSFTAPGPGTITVELSNIAWPQQLSALSFLAGSAQSVMSSWAATSPQTESFFKLTSGGSYFVDVTATAGGSLDLGVYSLSLSFTPQASPVPLPASSGLLLGGGLLVLALGWALRQRPPLGSEAALRVS